MTKARCHGRPKYTAAGVLHVTWAIPQKEFVIDRMLITALRAHNSFGDNVDPNLDQGVGGDGVTKVGAGLSGTRTDLDLYRNSNFSNLT